jgi:hypothetical protein
MLAEPVGVPTGYLPQEHEARQQDSFVLLLQALGMARWSTCGCSLRPHSWWRLQHQLHGEIVGTAYPNDDSVTDLNFEQMYTRASASDYDDFQAKGWTTKELIPLMRKHETYQRASNNRDIHGFEGPIKVSFGNYTYPIMQDFLRAVESQDIPVTDDLQDLTTAHGAEHWLKWINRYKIFPSGLLYLS